MNINSHKINKMDLQIPSIFSILFALVTIFTFMVSKITSQKASKLPPGPRKLPMIGNLHQLTSSLPHHTFSDLSKKYGPLMHLRLGQVPAVVVSSPEMAREVMKTHDVALASRPHILASDILSYGSVNLAFAPYGEYWRQLRKICIVELLSSSRVQSFKPLREDEFTSLVKSIASEIGSPINLSERIFSTMFRIISRATFGNTMQRDQEEFIEFVKEAVVVSSGFEIADLFPSVKPFRWFSPLRFKLEKMLKVSDRLLEKIIGQHKARKLDSAKSGSGTSDEDLLDVLLKFHECEDGFSLKIENIKALLLDIFAAGSETSSTAVDWSMAEMIKNPRIMKRAQDEVREVFNRKGSTDEANINEMKYLKCVVKETLRLHPSVPLLIPRECREKCEINGHEILEKTKVIVNAWAIGRDPKHWTEPDSFIPERFLDSSIDFKGTNFEYIPFGAGRRMCPGISFGIVNVELPLALLLYHFDWKLPDGVRPEEVKMDESFGATVRRKDCLHLVPIVYHPSPSEKLNNEN